MNMLEKGFIKLAFVEGKTYKEIESTLRITRQQTRELWQKMIQERDAVNKLKQLYRRKGFTGVSFSEFYFLYSGYEPRCCYCGITEEEIKQLFDRQLVRTKRSNTRGRSLELERVNPNEQYDNLENLKLACYWCNNAKSDEFTDREFIKIAAEIGKALKARLGQNE